MREYKFRGKRIDNGEWVYGSFTHCRDVEGHPSIIPFRANYHVPVDPETIGQYTGLKDRNGKDVYDGDVMASVTYGGEPMVVRWDSHGGFYLHSKNNNDDDHLNAEEIEMSEVLGNVFTNPHLLEQGEKE